MPHSIRSGVVRPLSPTTAGHEPPTEPCASCGEETAVGSVFFSDRHAVELADGRPAKTFSVVSVLSTGPLPACL